MSSRFLTTGVAFLLAATATVAVFLYVRGVEQKAEHGAGSVEVIVAKEDIPTGTDLNDLLTEGAFTTASVPEGTLVPGVVTELEDLRDQTTSSAILAGEQVSTARLSGSENELPGGVLGIPPGYEALSVPLEIPRVVAGVIKPGDHVAIHGSFDREGVTTTLADDAEVLKIVSPEGFAEDSASVSMITFALKPNESQRVVLGQELGRLWLTLLPPGQKGKHAAPVTIGGVVR